MFSRLLMAGLAALLFSGTVIGGQAASDEDNFKAAILAIKEGNIPKLKNMLKENRGLVDVVDKRYGATLLHFAAAQRDAGAIDELTSNGASLQAINKERAIPLLLALVPNSRATKSVTELKRLLNAVQRLATQTNVNIPNIEGKTALHLACEYGETQVVEFLISLGANVNAQTVNKKFPADYASDDETKRILRNASAAQPPAPTAGETPLHVFARSGNLAGVRSLLEQDRSGLERKTGDGDTPLLLAAKNCRADVVAYLIKQGADYTVKDANGRTYLQLCVPQPPITR